MATYKEIVAENERLERERAKLHDQLDQLRGDSDPLLQYTLDSGTRCTIGGLFGERLTITQAGDDPATGRTAFLTLGMLSVDDLREFLEIRLVIEAWKAGKLAELPMPKEPFAPWVCPPEFVVTLIGWDDD
jgi:hypothetical protein